MSRRMIAPLSTLFLVVGVYAAVLNFTFTVTNASITTSGTGVSVSGPASLTVSGVGTDTGTFSASGTLANISGGNVTVPFTITLGHGTLSGTNTFPVDVLVGSGPVSGSATITSGTGLYVGLGNTTVSGSGFSGSVLAGGTLSFSVSGTANGRNFTFTVTNAPIIISGTSVFSGPASLTLAGNSDMGTFTASGSLTAVSGNLSIPFTVTLGHGTMTGTMTFPETALLNSGPVSGSATITGGTGSYAGLTSSTLTASGTVTGSLLSGGTLSFSISAGTVTTGGSTLVAPGGWTSSSGTNNTIGVISNSNNRYQELIGPEQFGSGTMISINQIAFRAFPGTGPLNLTIANLAVYLSTSPLFPNTDNGRTLMSTTFANNVGSDNTLVYSGPASATSPGCAGPSPCPFDIVITFSTPFLYNPALGSLLVDLQSTGLTSTQGSFDDALFPYPPGGSAALVSGALNAATGSFYPLGHVVQFGYTGCSYFLNSAGQSLPAAGGTVNANAIAPAGCAWTITGTPNWVTPSAMSGAGTTALSFQVGANAGPLQTAQFTIAGLSFNIWQEAALLPNLSLIGSMAHIAAEENWTTSFTLVNKGSTSATAQLNLYGDPSDPTGSGPLSLTLDFPQLPLGMNRINSSSEEATIPPNALAIAATEVKPAPTSLTGIAQVLATGDVDGFAIFHLIPGAQEAVVPLETRNASSYLLAFDNTNGVVLAVAVANVSSQAANIPVIVRDSTGVQIATGTIALPGNGHKAFVLSDAANGFPVTANTTGTVEFDTPLGGQISVLGIRTTPLGASKTITTVPALANVGTGGGSFSFLATGLDGWQSTFVLVNAGTTAASATLSFYDPSGHSLALPVSYPQTGPAISPASSITQNLAAGASLTVLSVGTPASLVEGSAQLTTSGNVSGFAIFRFNPTGQEAVVPMESRNAPAYLLAYDSINGIATGISVSNVTAGAGNVIIPVTTRDDMGNLLATHNLTLSPNGEFSGNPGTPTLWPEIANLRGTIEFDTPAGAQIAVLGIRTPPGIGGATTYTTLPALTKP